MAEDFDDIERQSLTPIHREMTDGSVPTAGADPWVIKPLEEFITRLNFALSSTLLYPTGHPVVNETAEKMHQILESLLEHCPSIAIQFREEEVIYQGELLLESSFLARQLSASFQQREIGKITFLRGIKPEEIRSLVYSFHSLGSDKNLTLEIFSRILDEKNVIHIRFDRLTEEKDKIPGSRFDIAKKIYTSGTELIESVALQAVSQKIVNIGQVRPLVQDLIDNLSKDRSALLSVSALKSFDNYLFTHSMNVCILSLSLSIYLNIDPIRLIEIGTGAILHDIGKVFIPPEIIHKPGKLSAEEWQVMKQHPGEGAKMILRSRYATELPVLIIYAHHWKYALEDGYPQTRRKFKQNPFVFLVSICDCYDAMTTNRPYNRIHLPADALSIIHQMAGTALDPTLVYFFQKMIGPYPIGTLVKLESGEVGIVLQLNPDDIDRPQIKIILDSHGSKVDDILLIDLSEKDEAFNRYPYSIAQVVDPTTVSFNIWEYL